MGENEFRLHRTLYTMMDHLPVYQTQRYDLPSVSKDKGPRVLDRRIWKERSLGRNPTRCKREGLRG